MLGNQLEVPTGTIMKHVIEHKYVYLLAVVAVCYLFETNTKGTVGPEGTCLLMYCSICL